MGITISFGIQKGGSSKTTSCFTSAYLLSKEAKVLAVDFDSQGNLTEALTGRLSSEFEGISVLEAVKENNPVPYIINVSENLDLLPAEYHLATFSRWLYTHDKLQKKQLSYKLKNTLAIIKDQYDYIFIDLPPNLSETTINGLAASDFGIIPMQCQYFSIHAGKLYIDTMKMVQEHLNPNLRLLGVLITMLDLRENIDIETYEDAKAQYGDLLFNQVIHRRTKLKVFTKTGVQEKSEADREALAQYKNFLKEMKLRVQGFYQSTVGSDPATGQ